jgi:hypothetical protein
MKERKKERKKEWKFSKIITHPVKVLFLSDPISIMCQKS